MKDVTLSEFPDIKNQYGVSDRVSFTWQHLIAQIALRIREPLELPKILQITADQTHQLLKCDRVLLYQFAPDWSGQVVVEAVSAPEFSLIERVQRDFCFEDSWLKPYQDGHISSIADIAAATDLTPCHVKFLTRFQVRANLVVPILSQSQLWGFLIAHNCATPRQWLPEEINGLQQIAVHVSIALYQADLLEQLQAAKADLEVQVEARTSELIQTNQQLLQSEARFQHLVAQVPSIIYTVVYSRKVPTYFEYISSAVTDIFEITPEQVYADISLLFRQWHPEDRETYEAISQLSLTTLEPFSFEWRIITPSGTIKWLSVRASVERRHNGDVFRHGIVKDVSDRKSMELAIQESEARQRAMLEAIPDLLLRVRADGLCLDFIFPSSSQNQFVPIQQHLSEVLPPDLLERQIQAMKQAIATKELQVYNHQLLKFGHLAYEEVRVAAINDDEALVIVRDTTAQVELAQRLEQISQNIPGVIYQYHLRTDGSSHFPYASEGIRGIYGVSPEEVSVDATPVFARLHPEDLAEVGRSIAASAKNLTVWRCEYRVCFADGRTIWVYGQATPQREPDGSILWHGYITEITDRKQNELALQQANQQLEMLNEISNFLQTCKTVEQACTELSYLLDPLFPNCTGGISLIVTTGDWVEDVSAWGKLIHGEAALCIEDCPVLCRGQIYATDEDEEGLDCKYISGDNATANLCIPLIAQGETLGVFYLSTKIPNALPEAKQTLACTVADRVALAIANLRLQESLKQQSIRDTLTGLFNRRYLEEIFNQELLRAQRQQHEIGVIMLDIDHFKGFNDTYGHEAGDYVLKAVSTLLQEHIRRSDIVCRYGGEEMILLLPDSPLETTRMRAEELRKAIAQITLSYNSQSLGNLTASLGVASFPHHGTTGNTVIQAADAALYRAKDAGRNQVVVAS